MGHGRDNLGHKPGTRVRADIWLWSIRVFKTQNLSTKACKSGKVKINGKIIKPAKLIAIGEILNVRKNGIQYSYQVVEPICKRLGFEQAQLCYLDVTTEAELEKLRQNKTEMDSVFYSFGSRQYSGKGRPTKKNRRNIDKLRPDDN
jgi:ribosome-associated heat shock protein Hsp15